jgi:hypothetical protein
LHTFQKHWACTSRCSDKSMARDRQTLCRICRPSRIGSSSLYEMQRRLETVSSLSINKPL